jgi:hypothetical protein
MTSIFGWKRVATEATREKDGLVTQLAVTETKLEAAERQLSDMKRTLARMERKAPEGHMTVRITNKELLSTKETYEAEVRRHADTMLRKYRDDTHECFALFDKILYQSSEIIAKGTYLDVLDNIAKLDILGSYILNNLLGKSTVFSFFLYLTDTEYLHHSLRSLPAINTDFPYLIKQDDPTVRRDVDYIEVRMTSNALLVLSPRQTVEFPLRQRKTVLRVAYALFTKKYHLYHLWDATTSDDTGVI